VLLAKSRRIMPEPSVSQLGVLVSHREMVECCAAAKFLDTRKRLPHCEMKRASD